MKPIKTAMFLSIALSSGVSVASARADIRHCNCRSAEGCPCEGYDEAAGEDPFVLANHSRDYDCWPPYRCWEDDCRPGRGGWPRCTWEDRCQRGHAGWPRCEVWD